jgi:hypothetical protein
VENLTKKQKFIILFVIGSILIIGAFVWSMIINLSQISISNPVPEVTLPEEITDIIDESKTNTQNNTQSKELQEIVEILEQEQRKDKSLEEENTSPDNNRVNTDINLEQQQE